jgi:hypothetical protein
MYYDCCHAGSSQVGTPFTVVTVSNLAVVTVSTLGVVCQARDGAGHVYVIEHGGGGEV